MRKKLLLVILERHHVLDMHADIAKGRQQVKVRVTAGAIRKVTLGKLGKRP